MDEVKKLHKYEYPFKTLLNGFFSPNIRELYGIIKLDEIVFPLSTVSLLEWFFKYF